MESTTSMLEGSLMAIVNVLSFFMTGTTLYWITISFGSAFNTSGGTT